MKHIVVLLSLFLGFMSIAGALLPKGMVRTEFLRWAIVIGFCGLVQSI